MHDDVMVASLESLSFQHVRQYGPKAANLGEVSAIGMKVPPGIAIGRSVLAYFLRENGVDLAALDRTYRMGMVFFESAVRDAQEHQTQIVEAVTFGAFPNAVLDRIDRYLTHLLQHPVAVRSSCVVEDAATSSFAGQYTTVLDVSDRDEVLKAIRTCWASQYDGRVLKYALSRRGLPVLVPSMAVLIQQMLNPEHAGVCFTEGPTPKTRSVSIVESVPGLGEQLVSGARTPHYFEIDHNGLILTRRTPKNDLSPPPADDIVCEVAQAARRVAAHFGAPQDIEWATEGGRLYLLQARPITVLGSTNKVAALIQVPADRNTDPSHGSTIPFGSEASVRDDLYELLIEQIDPTLLRGAAFIVGSQSLTGSWDIDGYPEWNVVSTALIVAALVDGGVPPTGRWTTATGCSGGPAPALSWLASQVNADHTWGTDLWDTCQVVRTLLRCGVSVTEPMLLRAAEKVREGILDRVSTDSTEEWFGAGFYAAAYRMFKELGHVDTVQRCYRRLLQLQAPTGDFPSGVFGGTAGAQVPSEWHTSQVISALAAAESDEARTAVVRARTWLLNQQQSDGSWGASDGPYEHFNGFFTAYAILALLDCLENDSEELKEERAAVAKACRWLRHRQIVNGSFGDVASSLMAVTALQRFHGPAFSVKIPIATLLRIQSHLSSVSELGTGVN